MARPAVATHRGRELAGWSWASTPAGAEAPPAGSGAWRALDPSVSATTVAAALRAAGLPHEDQDLDAHDHWFICALGDLHEPVNGARTVLHFGGLATIAEAWLDGQQILSSQSMFASHTVDITGKASAGSVLRIRFASLDAWLGSVKRPRPRWKTRLVEDQRLRFARTALLGRIASWGPRTPPVGPWRPVTLEQRHALEVVDHDVRSSLDPGGTGTVEVQLTARVLDDRLHLRAAHLHVGGHTSVLDTAAPGNDGSCVLTGSVAVDGAVLWWPHTHGTPALHDIAVTVSFHDGTELRIDLGRTGFRTVEVDRGADGEGFALRINGEPVFCRGAVWMPPDPVSLDAAPHEVRTRLRAMVDAGMNMVRISGVTAYETDAFHAACDELGILVWQDLMLANLDVPFGDPAMRAQIETELQQLLSAHQTSPSLAVLCGSSELDQQATMVGIPTAEVERSMLHTDLPALVAALRPDVAVVPSSPSGGHLPFTVDSGVGHYYGVGAYLRPLADARHAGVRFTSECLAFANVPSPRTVRSVLGAGNGPTHPRWKAGVPRDAAAGWDFEDVRDHYVAELFGVDPVAVRWADPERWLALGRAAGAEVMQRTMAEWRRPAASCAGALVWFLNDLADGAGWGLLERSGRPKAAWYGLARALAPQALLLSDEGVNGLDIWAVNDRPQQVTGTLDVVLIRDGRTPVGSGSLPVDVAAHQAVRVRADAVIGRFTDPTYAYRFGPPSHHAVVATWRAADGTELATGFHFPHGLHDEQRDLGLAAVAVRTGPRTAELTVSAQELARFITIDAGDAVADRDHFHLAPGASATVALRATGDAALPARVFVSALNARNEAGAPIPAWEATP